MDFFGHSDLELAGVVLVGDRDRGFVAPRLQRLRSHRRHAGLPSSTGTLGAPARRQRLQRHRITDLEQHPHPRFDWKRVQGGGLAYRSSKTAVNAVTLLTAQALGEHFKVNALAPGLRRTYLIAGISPAATRPKPPQEPYTSPCSPTTALPDPLVMGRHPRTLVATSSAEPRSMESVRFTRLDGGHGVPRDFPPGGAAGSLIVSAQGPVDQWS